MIKLSIYTCYSQMDITLPEKPFFPYSVHFYSLQWWFQCLPTNWISLHIPWVADDVTTYFTEKAETNSQEFNYPIQLPFTNSIKLMAHLPIFLFHYYYNVRNTHCISLIICACSGSQPFSFPRDLDYIPSFLLF